MVGSDEQRAVALRKANEVRVARAKLKERLKSGTLDAGEVLADPPAIIETMKLRELLQSVPKVGKVKATRILRATHTETLPVGRVSPCTRAEIVRRLP